MTQPAPTEEKRTAATVRYRAPNGHLDLHTILRQLAVDHPTNPMKTGWFIMGPQVDDDGYFYEFRKVGSP